MNLEGNLSDGLLFGRLFPWVRVGKFKKKSKSLVKKKLKEPTVTEAGDGESPYVSIEPISAKAKRQTLLKKRRIDGAGLLIGRRGSLAELSDEDMQSYLISQVEPYTISKRQCQVEIRGREVWLKDLGSRFGTSVDGVLLRGGESESGEIILEPGKHSLLLGAGSGSYEFTVTVGRPSEG